jgi:hypothetical protein
MKSRDVSCRIGLTIGGVAIVSMMAMTAGCSKGEDKPSETPEPTKTSGAPSPSGSSPAPVGPTASPTEKAPTLTPGGPNSFTPSVVAPAAPTALPGNVITGG